MTFLPQILLTFLAEGGVAIMLELIKDKEDSVMVTPLHQGFVKAGMMEMTMVGGVGCLMDTLVEEMVITGATGRKEEEEEEEW